MSVTKHFCFAFGVAALSTGAALAQQASSPGRPPAQVVRFHVVAMTEAGECVTDLRAQEITVLDNDSVQPITSFRAVTINSRRTEFPRLVNAALSRTNRGCYRDGELFQYELTFHVPDAARANEFRRVGIKVQRPQLILQTRQGYSVPDWRPSSQVPAAELY